MKNWIKGHVSQVISVVVMLTLGVALCFVAEANKKEYKLSLDWMNDLIVNKDFSNYSIYGIDALSKTVDSITNVEITELSDSNVCTVKVTYIPYVKVESFDESVFTELKEKRLSFIQGDILDNELKQILQRVYDTVWNDCFVSDVETKSQEFTFTVGNNGNTPKSEQVYFIDTMLKNSNVEYNTEYYNSNISNEVVSILKGD